MELDGRVALVTGAGSGMGRATAERLVKEGMQVCVVDIDLAAAEAVAEPIGAHAIKCDVSDPEQVDRAFATCVERFGAVDLAHLNAGVAIGWSGDIGELTNETYRKSVGVMLDGVVFGARAAVRAMRARTDGREGGVIVVTASIAGVMPFHPEPIYTTSKHGAIGFVRAIAPNLAAEGIAVHALCPGTTATGMVADEHREMFGKIGVPVQPPEHVAEAVVQAATAPLSAAGTCWIVQADTPPFPFEFATFEGPDAVLNVHK